MNIKDIEKQIVAEVLNDNQDFEKAVLSIFGYNFSEVTSFSFPLEYFKNNVASRLQTNWSISDDIFLLLNLMFKEGIKTTKGTFTIYPSGEYESDFIWDNESHLGYLYDKVYNSLCFLAEELSYKITYTLCPETVILWEQTTITLPFVKGKIQPLQIKVKTEKEVIEHFLLIKDITYEESPWLVEQFEDMHQLTNKGELKGKLSERWNTLVICWNLMERFDLEKHVSFEWREENA